MTHEQKAEARERVRSQVETFVTVLLQQELARATYFRGMPDHHRKNYLLELYASAYQGVLKSADELELG